MMFGYARGRYLMAKRPPLLMLRTMMTGAMPGAVDSAAKGKVYADDFKQAHGQVRHRDQGELWPKPVARPLGIQPSINNYSRFLLRIGQLQVLQL
jgi:hypothetical protein